MLSTLRFYILIIASFATSPCLLAQQQFNTSLDPSPYVSARSASLGGAMSTLADGYQALFYNPATIGDVHVSKKDKRLLRSLSFPYFGLAIAPQTIKLKKKFDKNLGKVNESILNSALLNAERENRQYARSSLLFGFVLGKFATVYYNDNQLVAFKPQKADTKVFSHIRSKNGAGMGFAIANSKRTLRLGFASFFETISTFSGENEFADYSKLQTAYASIQGKMKGFTGQPNHVGLHWILAPYGNPTLALVAKNMGGTLYSGEGKGFKEPENITFGFSLSPKISKKSACSLILEVQHLTNLDLAVNKKFRLATELGLGGIGGNAPFSIRAGYNLAGVSFGLGFNLGLLQLHFAQEAEDIGIGNKHKVEKRYIVRLAVDVAAP